MKNLYSLFLSQAYRDCWDDYNRSLKLKNFPKWDYVILTASVNTWGQVLETGDKSSVKRL